MLRKLVVICALLATPAGAQDKSFRLMVPDVLADTGLMQHLLPRFSLKTGVWIAQVQGNADAEFGVEGTPVFKQGNTIWHFSKTEGTYQSSFEEWLLSDIGKRTIDAFAPDGATVFSSDVGVTKQERTVVLSGDMVLGEKASLHKCGRCHVVNDTNRMNAIGSTPSFALMRTFPDWQERFETFFTLRPHPAFTQVPEITEPFAENLPSPIAPITVTWEEIEAITAYVSSLAPADLGAPMQLQ